MHYAHVSFFRYNVDPLESFTVQVRCTAPEQVCPKTVGTKASRISRENESRRLLSYSFAISFVTDPKLNQHSENMGGGKNGKYLLD